MTDRDPRLMSDEDLRRAEFAATMLACPAYRNEGTCSNGCHSEPACQTDGPWEIDARALLDHIDALNDENGRLRERLWELRKLDQELAIREMEEGQEGLFVKANAVERGLVDQTLALCQANTAVRRPGDSWGALKGAPTHSGAALARALNDAGYEIVRKRESLEIHVEIKAPGYEDGDYTQQFKDAGTTATVSGVGEFMPVIQAVVRDGVMQLWLGAPS